jgi:hypothetical protein
MFLCRAINIKGDLLFSNPNIAYLLIQRIEDIGDTYKTIIQHTLENKKKYSPEVISFFKEIISMQVKLQEFYFDYDSAIGENLLLQKDKLARKGNDLIEKVKKQDIMLMQLLNSLIFKIYESASPIYGLKM